MATNAALYKKVNGEVVQFYPQTTAEMVNAGDEKTVKDRLDSIDETLKAVNADNIVSLTETVGDSSKGLVKDVAQNTSDISDIVTEITGTIDTRVKAACDKLYNQIMGITEEDGTTVTEAYDTLKEVAAYINSHETGFVASATTDINDLKTTVGDSTSGLVKALTDLTARVKAIEDNYIKITT